MRKLKYIRRLLSLLAVITQCTIAFGQKLPKIQTASVRASKSVKVDGKLSDANNKFSAYNSGQHIYYTISNDDNNLYLTAFTDDKLGSAKVFRGGITFTVVNPTKGKNDVSVTFPAIKSRMEGINITEVNPLNTLKLLDVDTTNTAKVDSLLASSNSKLKTIYKQIHVTGVTEIVDPFIPVYNIQNILVGAGFDKKLRYTYELAIPLKYIQALAGTSKSFKYNIRLNSEPIVQVKSMPNPGRIMILEPLKVAGGQGSAIAPSLDDEFLFNTTNFSGEYTLAK